MKKTIFLSLPMKDRTDEAINETINGMKRIITAMYPNDELVFVDNFYCMPEGLEDAKHKSLIYLGEAIRKMAKCDYIAVIENHNCDLYEYRGCYIESEVARSYGLHFISISDYDGSILIPDIKAKVDEQCKLYQPKEEACCCSCNN